MGLGFFSYVIDMSCVNRAFKYFEKIKRQVIIDLNLAIQISGINETKNLFYSLRKNYYLRNSL